jgi:hypothetical protein
VHKIHQQRAAIENDNVILRTWCPKKGMPKPQPGVHYGFQGNGGLFFFSCSEKITIELNLK